MIKHIHRLHRAYHRHRKVVARYVGGENLVELKVVLIILALFLIMKLFLGKYY